MKTVFICIDWFHPAYKAGGPVQSIVNMVRQYENQEVLFKIFTSNTDLDGSLHRGVPYDEWCYFNHRTEVWYGSRRNQTYAVFLRELAQTGASVLYVIGMFSWYTKQWQTLRKGPPVKKIISTRGMMLPGALTQKAFKKKLYIAAWKKLGLYKDYYFHASDPMEAQYLKQSYGADIRVQLANNFPRIFPFSDMPDKKAGILHLVSIGLISPMKNILLVLQALQDCTSDIRYTIYGPVKDDDYWTSCLEQIKALPANITVRYKGDLVPGDVEAALRENEVFILPSKSENFGHALYEAVSAGRPLITSHTTPFNYLEDHKSGKNVSIDDHYEMTDAIEFFAAMPAEQFAKWNEGAWVYSGKHLDLTVLTTQYDRLFLTEDSTSKISVAFNKNMVREG